MLAKNIERLVPVVLALLVVGAGCLGGGPVTQSEGAAPSATPTPTSTPTPTATPSPTPEPVDYPEGFDESGYENRSAAIQGHVETLTETSFTSETRFEFDSETVTITVKGNPETGRVSKVRRTDRKVNGKFFYENGTTQDSRRFADGEMSYREALTFDGQFETVFWAELSNPEVDRNDERTLFTYDVVGDHEGSLTVTGNGLIVSYRIVEDDGTVIEYSVSDVGSTSVEEPP